MDVKVYLNRINYQHDISEDVDTLFQLQKAHLYTVPFENLDIHYGRTITLDLDKMYQKVVQEKRGGFCYELNGLFHQLLKELGFDVQIISARVYGREKQFGPEYDHLAILAQIHQKTYLVDVGFGQFSLEPLTVELGILQNDAHGVFRFEQFDEKYLIVNKIVKELVEPQYIFSTESRKLQEFQQMCIYHQTSNKSHFTRKKVITLPTQSGRITLNNDNLKITKGTEIIEHPVESNQEFEALLDLYFGIKIQN